MSHHILFVDDEPNILSSLKRAFIDIDEYELSFAVGGDIGLQILKNNPASLIVSDMRMPKMDGVEFLKQAKQLCPNAVCMVLSGYADIKTIIAAVNEGHIWRFITKPWNDDELQIAIGNGIAYFEKSMEAKQLLDELERKNTQLVKINFMLEDMVCERTNQLKERNTLLHMIVDNHPLELIMSAALEAILRMTNATCAYVTNQLTKEVYGGTELPEPLSRLYKRLQETDDDQYTESEAAIRLIKDKTVLGTLFICFEEEPLPILRVRDVAETIGSIVIIALSQHNALQEMPELLKTLNEIEGDL